MIDDIHARISDDWLRREGELRRMDGMVLKNKDELTTRCSIFLTYSHWEGHFKTCASELLEFISAGVQRKFFRWDEIKEETRLRLLFCKFRRSSVSGQSEETFIDYLNALNDRRYFDVVSAASEIIMIDDNLSAIRAEAICKNLGIDHSWCSLKKVTIDERLLAYRNALAHGSDRLRDGTKIEAYNDTILGALHEMRGLIRETRDRFSNAIVARHFLN